MLRKRSTASPPLGGAGPDARRYENKLLVILFLGFGLVSFDRQALLFLVPFISKDIPLSNTALGTLSGVLALTWALSGMISGRLSDRLGRRKPVIIIAVVLFSCLSASSGLVTGFDARETRAPHPPQTWVSQPPSAFRRWCGTPSRTGRQVLRGQA
ncbi:MFS transporter [Streptomyces canus]|uniref:MFS transporter n=1 Tax=Streptomyces canus TaxID=58343 RepID=UPI0033F0411A